MTQKQVVVVTGCTAGGIGYSMAKTFAQQGNVVFATARRIEAMAGIEEFGCEKVALDVTSKESIEAAVKTIIDKAGRIDVLVNNAGLPAVGALLDIDIEDAQRCVNTNVFGLLAVTKEVCKYMIPQKSGKIVNIGSVVGYKSTPWAGIYALSKAAVHSMSDTLRLELKPFNIQVTVVAPGGITSNFGKASESQVSVPEDSVYASVSKFIIARANMSQGPGSTRTDDFSAHIVKRVLQSQMPPYVTYGSGSWIFFSLYYLPAWFRDLLFFKRFGLDQLKYKSA
ncbi:NAD(P)-binding protein [Backusella circina FSU 941]|nr:NAD(P)-binding protein [Backusella circina FSU 941]